MIGSKIVTSYTAFKGQDPAIENTNIVAIYAYLFSQLEGSVVALLLSRLTHRCGDFLARFLR